jgi:hypothetical protein
MGNRAEAGAREGTGRDGCGPAWSTVKLLIFLGAGGGVGTGGGVSGVGGVAGVSARTTTALRADLRAALEATRAVTGARQVMEKADMLLEVVEGGRRVWVA